ncbi:MAG TPA: hypothetical protein VK576_06090 [Thermoleophilia bacterium]|nr:hypothetical protein [Thermoleophilia bacterium]
MIRHARFWKRLYIAVVVAYVALGFVFVGVAYGQLERISPNITTTPVTKVPTGNSDATAMAYYDYLQLRHLQQQTETYGVNGVSLIIIYGILGAVLLFFTMAVWIWHTRQKRRLAGVYPVEVYNGYISERGGPVDYLTWSAYGIMLTFMVFYIWWDMIFGQWY